MGSTYLQNTDYAAYGVPNATAANVTAASASIDAFLDRPFGCVVDTTNNVMLSTGAPILEAVIGGDQFILSASPLLEILSITNRESFGWEAVTWSYDFDADGTVHVDGWPAWVPTPLKVTYLAGWTYATLPSAIKQATANIIQNQLQLGAGNNGFMAMKAGDAQFTRAGTSLLDEDTRAMLAPYKRVFA